MPSSKNYVRDYKQELKTQKRRGEDKGKIKRVQARRKLEKAGKVRKGDGKDVDHKKPISRGGGNGKGNLTVKSKSKNRSYKRTSSGAIAKSSAKKTTKRKTTKKKSKRKSKKR